MNGAVNMNDVSMRCGACRKIVLNHPEPYLGTPEGIAAAPERAVAAQRAALIECSVCRDIREQQTAGFLAAADAYRRAHPEATSYSVATDDDETFGDHSDEWEDMATGARGGPGWNEAAAGSLAAPK